MSWIPFDDSLAPAWDAFVNATPGGRAVHLAGFKSAVEDIYRLEPFYRACLDGAGRIQAVFPGFFHPSRIYGRKIVSQPFSEYGGLLLAPDLDAAGERDAILEEFRSLAMETLAARRYGHLEMRFPMSLPLDDERFRVLPLFKIAVKRLEGRETMWKSLTTKDRTAIRRALKNGLTFAERTDEEALRSSFYPLYEKTMKRLGSPPHPLAWFFRLRRSLAESMRVFVVSRNERPVSSLAVWAVGRTIHITDMVSDETVFTLRPNDLAIWELLGWAADRGFSEFDFGPVRHKGQEKFKMKWGMELRDYSYRYLSLAAGEPRSPFSGSGGFMAAAPRIWSAAMPLRMARAMGRRLRREIGL